MSSSVLYMSMSLDGCFAGPNDESGSNPDGDDFDPAATHIRYRVHAARS